MKSTIDKIVEEATDETDPEFSDVPSEEFADDEGGEWCQEVFVGA